MSVFSRLFGRRPPAEAQAIAGTGERVVAWGRTDADAFVVATTVGLRTADVRLGWHQIHKAGWGDGLLTVIPSVDVEDGVVADGEPLSMRLVEPGDLPPEIRTRVTRSVAYSAHHQLTTGGVWVVGRRIPGVDGLTWVARYDADTDHADPATRAQVADLIETAARSAAPPQP
jgi:hypothetical protein